MLDSCNFSSVNNRRSEDQDTKLAVITEITQESNVYLKILDKLIIMRCAQKMHICSEEE